MPLPAASSDDSPFLLFFVLSEALSLCSSSMSDCAWSAVLLVYASGVIRGMLVMPLPVTSISWFADTPSAYPFGFCR